ncbi:hypothetical protein CA85_52470 [Allorhodopirellula solitaria]|uniref:Uncharacterized protein n=1 Tax=Allorhodopirellula solitaria TaxID=2527987 RepID=A0A5C5WLA5_9BACT|nr:hypothetical protein CA85_52470 [Allorhodopirellula solitaria]
MGPSLWDARTVGGEVKSSVSFQLAMFADRKLGACATRCALDAERASVRCHRSERTRNASGKASVDICHRRCSLLPDILSRHEVRFGGNAIDLPQRNRLIRRKRALEVLEAWLQYPMIDLSEVVVDVRPELPGETEPSSNGVDLGRIWRETILS